MQNCLGEYVLIQSGTHSYWIPSASGMGISSGIEFIPALEGTTAPELQTLFRMTYFLITDAWGT